MSIDLTLDRIKGLLAQFERYTRPTVHIAGTNGKGSVSAFLTSIFQAAGLSVGRFNSPHLITPSDSIAINSTPISESLYSSIKSEVEAKNDRTGFEASPFEVLMLVALLAFERTGVDVVVCEVGLGGRLDATSIIPDDCIIASVITSIALDHVAFLGPTPAAIAREKAGIVRRNGLVVLAKQVFAEAASTVEEIAGSLNARCVHAPVARIRDWDGEIDGPGPLPFSVSPFYPPPPLPVRITFPQPEPAVYELLLSLHGDHQLENLGVAITVIHSLRYESNASSQASLHERLCRMPNLAIHSAVRDCRWPGRLSFHRYPVPFRGSSGDDAGELVVLADGAHNEAAARTLASYISNLFNSLPQQPSTKAILTFILGLSHSPPKTPESVLIPLLNLTKLVKDIDVTVRAAFVEFAPPEGMPWVKPVPPPALRNIARNAAGSEIKEAIEIYIPKEGEERNDSDILEELEKALAWAGEGQEEGGKHLVVIAGSLYLVADFYRLIMRQT